MGYLVEATSKKEYFSNELEDLKKFLPRVWGVELAEISFYKINDSDREHLHSNRLKEIDPRVDSASQSYTDLSEVGKIKYIDKSFSYDEETEVTTEIDTVTKEIVGVLV